MTDVALPEEMPAAFNEPPGRIRVGTRPVPTAGPGEVVLEVRYCGVCGSDVHAVLDGWGPSGNIGGHEYSGRIVAVGPDVEEWAVGDLVIGGPGRGCERCDFCLAGDTNLCRFKGMPGKTPNAAGAFATYKLNRTESLYRVPPGLDLRVAALTEPLSVALHAIRRIDARAGERALVTGAGPIGLLAIAALRYIGVDHITVSEPGELRRAKALAVGATHAVAPDEIPRPANPLVVIDDPFQIAVECSGNAGAMESALGALDRRGRMVHVGAGRHLPKLDFNRVLLNEMVVTGSAECNRTDFEDSIAMLASGRLRTDELIEPADVPLTGLQDALFGLAEGRLPGKVMVVPSL
jgi:(R,R)-butanediol dehydrogenase/meso-butanediol dehydrogenase/diacetyl reductase